ncbi:unnamed protein product [Lactuca virosa]|uniref:Uncharacterized protein n=1 Tax=Lactuca virosa TaxID=75947 RepID=A0AAU9P560_9ASTR|nr:unnamed protein product [Lactuca virosa]
MKIRVSVPWTGVFIDYFQNADLFNISTAHLLPIYSPNPSVFFHFSLSIPSSAIHQLKTPIPIPIQIPPMTKPTNLRCFTAILLAILLLSQYSFAAARPLTTGYIAASSTPEKVQFDAGKFKSLYLSSLPKKTRVPASGPSRRTNANKT